MTDILSPRAVIARNFILVFLAVIMQSCHRSLPIIPPTEPGEVIIVVPGFKGSLLADSKGELVWINASQAIFGKTSLALPNPKTGIENIELFDHGMLKTVGIIPGIADYDLYSKFLKRLSKRSVAGTRIVEFHYDWRRDNFEAVKALDRTVRAERDRGATAISVIGHSMGGLIVAYYLRYGATDPDNARENWDGAAELDQVVFAGTPFRGSLTIFHDMLFGSTTGLNSNFLTADATCSFNSSYQLLPIDPVFEAPFEADLFNVNDWHRYRWGFLRETQGVPESIVRGRIEFVSFNLKRARKIFDLIHAPVLKPFKGRLLIKNIVGTGRKTDTTLPWNEERGELDFRKIIRTDGDGVVTTASAHLPPAYQNVFETSVVETNASHLELLSGNKQN